MFTSETPIKGLGWAYQPITSLAHEGWSLPSATRHWVWCKPINGMIILQIKGPSDNRY